jgi:YD repeat-containing protein
MYRSVLICFICIGFVVELNGGVNIKNGNFYLSYTDLDLTAKKGIDITRTYNSSSVEDGLFGFGWGSMLETRLYIIGDGNLVVKYWGGGSMILYTSNQPDEELLNTCLDQLVTAAIENEDLENNPSDISAFRTLLRQSVNERVKKWIKYDQLDLVRTPDQLSVTQWRASMLSFGQITLNADGFVQLSEDGSSDRFNKDGYLTAHLSAGGNPVFEVTYKIGNRISTLTDKGGNVFYFSLTSSGKVERITTRGGSSRYWYKDNLLVRSVDAGKNDYRFGYDSAYNMRSVHYTDGTAMYMEYEEATNFCKKVTDRKGAVTEYVYKFFYEENGEVSPNHFATYVLKQSPGKPGTDSAYYEYEIRDLENGEEYQYRYFQNLNGNTYEEINDEQCRWPVILRKNQQELRFRYSAQCGILSRDADSLRIEAQLDSLLQQPVQLLYIDKQSNDTLLKQMELNEYGKPVRIRFRNTDTRITYNKDQLPVEIVFEKGTLTYIYDAYNRVIQVRAGTTGVLELEYDQNNEISKRSSKQGSSAADQIYALYEAATQRIKNAKILYTFDSIVH